MICVCNFTLHGSNGKTVLDEKFLEWLQHHKFEELGATIVAYSWTLEGRYIEMPVNTAQVTWRLLPDASGFICFERGNVPNNCTLLDAYGKERMRLTVPWQLTTANNPASNAPPTCFAGLSSPHINPADGKIGQFGVKAWVELAGEYYFELDWCAGKFLWGKEIRF